MDTQGILMDALHEIVEVAQAAEVELLKSIEGGHGESDKFLFQFPPALDALRKKLANAAARVTQLATDPKEYLEQLSASNQHLICLRWIVNLGVLEHIPAQGSISYTELADTAGVPEHQLKSVVSMAAAHGFLSVTTLGHVSHSRTSSLMASDPSFYDWARWLTNHSVPTAYKFADATRRWGRTEKKNETAWNLAMGVDVPFFGYLKENAELNSMFSSYMKNVASSEATSFKHMIGGFDWGNLSPGATVVDVGGSGGHASRALASAFPDLKFIVQDLPDTIKNAQVDANGHNDRVTFMSHDFFTPQPITNADVYFLRMIIHDWPDETALTILSHLRDALKSPGARIVVMDTILPQPGAIPLLQERQLRVRDLTMMQVFNAKEREYDSWLALVESAGLRIASVQQPEGSNMGLLELGLAEQKATVPPLVSEPGTLQSTSDPIEAQTSGGHDQIPRHNVPPNGSIRGFVDRDPHDRDVLPVVIMGAGISGLCLAQHLHKHSIPFVVFERDPSADHRPQGYRLKLEADAATALRESLSPTLYEAFEASCAISAIGETDFDPISGACIKSRRGGGLAGSQGLRATYTVDRSIFRRILMTGIESKILFGREIASYEIREDNIQPYVIATFKDGATVQGRFLVGADGTRSAVRKQLTPEHKFLDTGAVCIYGKTNMSPELLARYPERALRWMTVCTDTSPLIQSILIGDSPLTLLSEPIRFAPESRKHWTTVVPDDYVYWVLIGRKEHFLDVAAVDTSSTKCELDSASTYDHNSSQDSAAQSLALTEEWHPSLRSLFELQDVSQASTMRVVSAPPKLPVWTSSPCVTLLGDAVHAMSPCGGVGANVALRDAAELGKLFVSAMSTKEGVIDNQRGGKIDAQFPMEEQVAAFEDGLRKRAFGGIMRSFVGSQRMFDQKPFEQLSASAD